MTESREQREFRYADLIGRWRLRLTPEFRQFVARSIGHDAPALLTDTTLDEAMQEAAGAELELYAGGQFVSRSHGGADKGVSFVGGSDARAAIFARPPEPGRQGQAANRSGLQVQERRTTLTSIISTTKV